MLCRKHLFHEKIENNKKEAGTNFIWLCQSTNMVAKFKKTYLYRPIKILQFLTPSTIQKFLT